MDLFDGGEGGGEGGGGCSGAGERREVLRVKDAAALSSVLSNKLMRFDLRPAMPPVI